MTRTAVGLMVLCLHTTHAAADPPVKYAAPSAGQLAVETVADLKLDDKKRGKSLPVVVTFPTTGGPYPVIVFSHGAGGSGPMVLALPQFWSSHGYVCLVPTHKDSLSLQRNDKKADAPGDNDRPSGLAGRLMGGPDVWIDRPRDVTFLLDSLAELEKRVPGLAGKIDRERVGVGGHSLGAYTAQVAGGATVDLGGKMGLSLADERVDAVLQLSGQGVGQQGLTAKSWEKLTRPMLTMTGTRDRGAGGQDHTWKEDPFKHAPPGDKYHMIIDGAHHGSFTGRFAGEGPPGGGFGGGAGRLGGDQKAIFGYVKSATLAFWDAHLKGNPAAKAFLASDDLPTLSKKTVELKRK